MEIKTLKSQSFGMAFPRNGVDCNKYLASTFNNKSHKLNKALKELDRRCDAHKLYDMFHSSYDDSIKIIGKNDFAGELMAKKYGDTILSLSRHVEYPNYAEKTQITLKELEQSSIGPQNKIERFMFKIFNYLHMQYAKMHVKYNPYESLPPNVRMGVDIIDELESKM